jgi:hypothetical protein
MSGMKKKAAFDLVRSEELSRLLTRERLHRAGFKLQSGNTADPDLDDLVKRLRSAVKKSSPSGDTIPADLVRKLAGG